MAYIHAKNENGDLISEGTELSPIKIGPLNASVNEVSAPTKVTFYTDAGFASIGNSVFSFNGTSAGKWLISDSIAGTYSETLTITSQINATGTDIYIKAATSSDEVPANDISVDLRVLTSIQAV